MDRVESGYAGGHVPQPTYKQVCTDTTGHAEVKCRSTLLIPRSSPTATTCCPSSSPSTISTTHAIVRASTSASNTASIILTHDDAQQQTAREVIGELTAEKAFERPIVTEVVPLTTFYRAEDEHQGYYRRNPSQGYCQAATINAFKMVKIAVSITQPGSKRRSEPCQR